MKKKVGSLCTVVVARLVRCSSFFGLGLIGLLSVDEPLGLADQWPRREAGDCRPRLRSGNPENLVVERHQNRIHETRAIRAGESQANVEIGRASCRERV